MILLFLVFLFLVEYYNESHDNYCYYNQNLVYNKELLPEREYYNIEIDYYLKSFDLLEQNKLHNNGFQLIIFEKEDPPLLVLNIVEQYYYQSFY